MVAVAVVVILTAAECLGVASAGSAPLPDSEWTSEAHVWTARVAVAEVGWAAGEHSWEKGLEHQAVWWALRTRWKQMSRRYPQLRYLDVVKAYCTSGRFNKTARQQWIRGLNAAELRPEAWPRRLRWERFLPLWGGVLERAHRWATTWNVRNPCPGAVHFGGTRAGDMPKGRMKRHPCSGLFESYGGNTFYLVRKEGPGDGG